MDRVALLLKTKPGRQHDFAAYVKANRLSQAALTGADVHEWNVYMQEETVLILLQAPDIEQTLKVLYATPEALAFEEGEKEFLESLELRPMEEIVSYP